MRAALIAFICSALVGVCMSTSEAKIINVPGDYDNLQDAGRFAEGGDIIQVAPGIYEVGIGSIEIAALFMKTPGPVTLQGAGAENTTIIDNIYISGGGVEGSFKIDGFRIEGVITSGGASITISHNFITNGPPGRTGKPSGGIRLSFREPSYTIRVEDNIIRNTNSGIQCEGDDDLDTGIKTDVLIARNVIEANDLGICCISTSPVIRENRIVGNRKGVWISSTLGNLTEPDLGSSKDPGGNTIYGNAEYDVQNGTDRIISAEYNYWGDAGGPEKGGNVLINKNGWIDYEPWLFSDEAVHFSVQPRGKLPSVWGKIKTGL